MSMMKQFSKQKNGINRLVLVSMMAVAVSGCDISDGNGLSGIRISLATDENGVAEVAQCVGQRLQLLGDFDNGSVGAFGSRATWTSSNPDIIQVSNGEIEAPGDGFFFSRGTVLPFAETRTGGDVPVTITASFAGLTTSIDLIVAPSRLEIFPAQVDLAANTRQQFRAVAVIDGGNLNNSFDLTRSVDWSMTQDDGAGGQTAPTVGEIDTVTGVFSGNAFDATAADTTLTVSANTGICELGTVPVSAAPATISFRNVDFDATAFELFLTEDDLSTPADETTTPVTALGIPLGFSQEFRVVGVFDSGGFRQDLTNQVLVTPNNSLNVNPEDENTSTVSVIRLTNNPFQVIATIAGSSQLNIELANDESIRLDNAAEVTTLDNVTPNDDGSLAISVASPAVPVPASGVLMLRNSFVNLRADAQFSDSVTRNVTRDVFWQSTNTNAVAISNLNTLEGLVTAQPAALGTSSITATINTSDANGPVEIVSGAVSVSAGESAADGEQLADDDDDNFTVIAAAIAGPDTFARGDTVTLEFLLKVEDENSNTFDQNLAGLAAVSWESTNSAIANVSNVVLTRGQIRIPENAPAGTAIITARIKPSDFVINNIPDANADDEIVATLDITLP